jgi:hypothetical protein
MWVAYSVNVEPSGELSIIGIAEILLSGSGHKMQCIFCEVDDDDDKILLKENDNYKGDLSCKKTLCN